MVCRYRCTTRTIIIESRDLKNNLAYTVKLPNADGVQYPRIYIRS